MTTQTEPQPAIRYLNGRRMQCKDIPDDVFIGAIRRTPGMPVSNWRLSWKVQEELEATIGWVPYNLFLAKARKMCDAGKIGGCPCGCRGDFHLPADCDDPTCCGGRSAG